MKTQFTSKIITAKVEDLYTAPWNPRKVFDEKLVGDIADDLRAGKPLIHRPAVWKDEDGKMYVIAGNTRMEAVRLAKIKEIEVDLWDCSKEDAMTMTFKENEQRSDVFPIQQAQLIGKIFDSGKNVEEIIEHTGLKKSSIYDYLKISSRVSSRMQELALKYPSNFSKGDLMELASFTSETQDTVIEDWSADADEYEDWTPSMYVLRNRTKSLKGCKWAGKGSKCATCPMNSANAGTLPGFADEDADGDFHCENGQCYNEMQKEYLKKLVAKKLKNAKESYRIRCSWEFASYGAKEKKPDADNPCAYYYVDEYACDVKVLYGASMKEKLEAEKKEREERKVDEDKKREERTMTESVLDVVIDSVCENEEMNDALVEKSFRSYLAYVLDYTDAIEKFSFYRELVSHFKDIIRQYGYHYESSSDIAKDLAKTIIPLEKLTPEQKAWMETK